MPGERKERVEQVEADWIFVFNQGRQSRQDSFVWSLKALEQFFGVYHNRDC